MARPLNRADALGTSLAARGCAVHAPRMVGAKLTAAFQREVVVPVIDLVFPPRCLACAARVAQHGGLCVACWGSLDMPGTPACGACQMPFGGGVPEGGWCGRCRAEEPRHAGIIAAAAYGSVARDLVLALKHGRRLGLADWMARMIAARLGQGAGAEVNADWLIVPVPLHRGRLWRRGFNQSALIAAALARQTNTRLVVDGLLRVKSTPSLGPLGSAERVHALAGAIASNPHRGWVLAGADVLLVDDVLTSGATSNACIAALHAAGAGRVVVACFARVLAPDNKQKAPETISSAFS